MPDENENISDETTRVLTELVDTLHERDQIDLPDMLPEEGEPKWSWLVRATNKLISLVQRQRDIPLPDPPEQPLDAGEEAEPDLPEMDVKPFAITGAGVNVHEQAGLTGIVGEPSPGGPTEEPLPQIDEGTGIAVMDETVVGRIPSNQYSIDRLWFLDRYYAAQTADPPVWRQVIMNLGLGAAGTAVGVPSPAFGKVVGLTVNCTERTGHGAGLVDFIPYNATTGGDAPQADAPQLDNLDPLNPTTTGYGTVLSDGLAVSFGDLIELWCRCAAGGQDIDFNAEASFIIKEQTAYVITGDLTPDATGVVVRLGQYGGKPACERIDGAYWLWWEGLGGNWTISPTLGVAVGNIWSRNDPNPVGAYPAHPAGTATGTATVAARND